MIALTIVIGTKTHASKKTSLRDAEDDGLWYGICRRPGMAVLKTIAAEGLPEPGFEESVERLRITVHIPNHDPRFFMSAWQRQDGEDAHRHIGKKSRAYVTMSAVAILRIAEAGSASRPTATADMSCHCPAKPIRAMVGACSVRPLSKPSAGS
jgi:hypothetical protein